MEGYVDRKKKYRRTNINIPANVPIEPNIANFIIASSSASE